MPSIPLTQGERRLDLNAARVEVTSTAKLQSTVSEL
jgi:hypothetical protein